MRRLAAEVAHAARLAGRELAELDQARYVQPLYEVLDDVGGTLQADLGGEPGKRVRTGPVALQEGGARFWPTWLPRFTGGYMLQGSDGSMLRGRPSTPHASSARPAIPVSTPERPVKVRRVI